MISMVKAPPARYKCGVPQKNRECYKVFIGKNNTKEIDFVANRRDERIYVQVCVQLPENSDREVGNLMEIKDHYPKVILTMDDDPEVHYDGIRRINARDWLLGLTD